ncbi:Ulp1 protease family [Abeliophyllum distichum]|uniref:Ulp1 protease family n=1 Tax=Abeliophyllum distichum TaxID=126358 RepID=A0ABD1Q0G4_9LAMI
MATFNKKISKKVTTTDSFFGSMVRGIYPAVVENSNALARQVSLLEYPQGEYMHCNTPWAEVDHVLMPIRMGVHAHWILVHLDIRNRCLNVYNSCCATLRDGEVRADVQPFALVIPHLMANIDVWQPVIVNGIQRIEPLVVNLVHDIPQQSNGTDCGVFVIKYAEYFMNNNMERMPNPFDATSERIYLASQLYKHGLHKINEGYESDPNFLSRRERKARKGANKK